MTVLYLVSLNVSRERGGYSYSYGSPIVSFWNIWERLVKTGRHI